MKTFSKEFTLAGVKRVGVDRTFVELDGLDKGDFLRIYVDGDAEFNFSDVYEVSISTQGGEQ